MTREEEDDKEGEGFARETLSQNHTIKRLTKDQQKKRRRSRMKKRKITVIFSLPLSLAPRESE